MKRGINIPISDNGIFFGREICKFTAQIQGNTSKGLAGRGRFAELYHFQSVSALFDDKNRKGYASKLIRP